MRNFKKILSLCLVLVLLVGTLSITAFADNDPVVTIYFQEVYRDENDEIDTEIPLLSGNYIQVTVNSGDYLKDAIVAACLDNNKPISNDIWDEDYQIYLESLKVGTQTYLNAYTIQNNTPVPGWSTYNGASWMFFYGTETPENTINYPDGLTNTLGTRQVTEDITITLSYEHTTFSWPN